MKYIAIIISYLLFLTSCSDTKTGINRDLLLPITDFKLDSRILKNGDDIEIICASEVLFPGDEVDYYIHALVVSQESFDTVNVLVTGVLDAGDNDRFKQYISPVSGIGLLIQNIETIEEEDSNIDDLNPQKHSWVYSDPEYMQLDFTRFPSTIGAIGKLETIDSEE